MLLSYRDLVVLAEALETQFSQEHSQEVSLLHRRICDEIDRLKGSQWSGSGPDNNGGYTLI